MYKVFSKSILVYSIEPSQLQNKIKQTTQKSSTGFHFLGSHPCLFIALGVGRVTNLPNMSPCYGVTVFNHNSTDVHSNRLSL